MTGAWFGHYSYADGRPAVQFIASLSETGGAFAGEISEPNSVGPSAAYLHAVVDGQRRGRSIRFTKLYDGEAEVAHSIHYEGELDEGGEEATGRWRLPTEHGPFRMTRAHVAEEEREEETADMLNRDADA